MCWRESFILRHTCIIHFLSSPPAPSFTHSHTHSSTNHESDFALFHNSIIKRTAGKGGQKPGCAIQLSLKAFHGELAQLRRDFPVTLTQNMVIVNKLGFADVILPGIHMYMYMYLCTCVSTIHFDIHETYMYMYITTKFNVLRHVHVYTYTLKVFFLGGGGGRGSLPPLLPPPPPPKVCEILISHP